MKKAFTLVELLVAISIIVLLTGIVILNFRSGGDQLALERAANQVAQDIKKAMEMALGGKEKDGSFPQGGYGIYFSAPSNSYVLFADNNPNGSYDPGEGIKTISLQEKNITIYNISPSSPLSITFLPPVPEVKFSVSASSVTITLRDNQGRTKTIFINQVGLVEIQ